MTQVNLLPWREQERKNQKIRFFYMLGGFLLATLILIFFIHIYLNSLVRYQQGRNDFIQVEIAHNQSEANQLEEKYKTQVETENKIKFLMNLQSKNYRAVQLLNELVNITPTSVSLEMLQLNNKTVTMVGEAQTNLDITLLMERLAHSKILTHPILKEINLKEGESQTTRKFNLTALQQE